MLKKRKIKGVTYAALAFNPNLHVIPVDNLGAQIKADAKAGNHNAIASCFCTMKIKRYLSLLYQPLAP